jgi:hypothetical protein
MGLKLKSIAPEVYNFSFYFKLTPFPAFPQGGRSETTVFPLGEIRKGVMYK